MKFRLLGLALILMLGIASATTYVKLSLEQQVEKADLIVRARVKEKLLQTRTGKIWTVYTLDVTKFYKGSRAQLKDSSFAVFDSDKSKLENAPRFNINDDLFLMLYAKAYDSPVVGFRQGAYKILDTNQVIQIDGKPVLLEEAGKPIEATLETFIQRLEDLTGSK